MEDVITIFRMKELKLETRINIIEKLCEALNYKYAANWTNDVCNELVDILKNEIIERDKQPF